MTVWVNLQQSWTSTLRRLMDDQTELDRQEVEFTGAIDPANPSFSTSGFSFFGEPLTLELTSSSLIGEFGEDLVWAA
jgi:hypothetical protein